MIPTSWLMPILFSGGQERFSSALEAIDLALKISIVLSRESEFSHCRYPTSTRALIRPGIHFIIIILSVLQARLAMVQRHDNRASHGTASV